jgi:hypothetical protein
MYLDNLLFRHINYTMNLKSAFLLIYCNRGSISLYNKLWIQNGIKSKTWRQDQERVVLARVWATLFAWCLMGFTSKLKFKDNLHLILWIIELNSDIPTILWWIAYTIFCTSVLKITSLKPLWINLKSKILVIYRTIKSIFLKKIILQLLKKINYYSFNYIHLSMGTVRKRLLLYFEIWKWFYTKSIGCTFLCLSLTSILYSK